MSTSWVKFLTTLPEALVAAADLLASVSVPAKVRIYVNTDPRFTARIPSGEWYELHLGEPFPGHTLNVSAGWRLAYTLEAPQ